MTERDPNTGTFVSKEPRPDPDALRTEIAELGRHKAELEARVRDKFLDCAMAGSFEAVAPMTEEIRQIADRVTGLQAQLPAIEQQEQDRIAEVRRREAISKVRALHAHANRARSGAKDFTIALNTLTAAFAKLTDGLAGCAATLDEASGFEIDASYERVFAEAAIADIAAALKGTPGHTLADLAERTVEAVKDAAGEMQRGVTPTEPAETDPSDDSGIAPAADPSEAEQEISDV